MRRPLLTTLLVTLLAPAAWGQAAPSADIRPGTYALDITFGGGVMQGTLTLAQAGDSLTARLQVGDHDSPVRAGARRGNRLALVPTTAGMAVHYDLEFRGDQVSGTFTYNGDAGTVDGRRKAGSGN